MLSVFRANWYFPINHRLISTDHKPTAHAESAADHGSDGVHYIPIPGAHDQGFYQRRVGHGHRQHSQSGSPHRAPLSVQSQESAGNQSNHSANTAPPAPLSLGPPAPTTSARAGGRHGIHAQELDVCHVQRLARAMNSRRFNVLIGDAYIQVYAQQHNTLVDAPPTSSATRTWPRHAHSGADQRPDASAGSAAVQLIHILQRRLKAADL